MIIQMKDKNFLIEWKEKDDQAFPSKTLICDRGDLATQIIPFWNIWAQSYNNRRSWTLE